MTTFSTATVETAQATGCLQQLCRHFGHKTEAEFTTETGWIRFEFGRADLQAGQGSLAMKAQAGNEEDLTRPRRVPASHLERFALRESLKIDWSA